MTMHRSGRNRDRSTYVRGLDENRWHIYPDDGPRREQRNGSPIQGSRRKIVAVMGFTLDTTEERAGGHRT